MYKMRTHGFHYKNVEFRTKKGITPFYISTADRKGRRLLM